MATDKHNLYDAADWNLWRDYLHDYPQWISDLDALGDEMHEYERLVHQSRRGYNVKVPERPNLSLRLAHVTNQSQAEPAE